MEKSEFPYSDKTIDRYGRPHWYYRRNGWRRTLPCDPAEDRSAYDAAKAAYEAGHVPEPSRDRLPEFAETITKLLSTAETRAARDALPFSLAHAWLEERLVAQGYRCSLTNYTFTPNFEVGKNPFAPSLVLIDAEKGYTPGNVRLVLQSVSSAVSEWGMRHFDMICRGRVASINRR
jgi:hypothetical protein